MMGSFCLTSASGVGSQYLPSPQTIRTSSTDRGGWDRWAQVPRVGFTRTHRRTDPIRDVLRGRNLFPDEGCIAVVKRLAAQFTAVILAKTLLRSPRQGTGRFRLAIRQRKLGIFLPKLSGYIKHYRGMEANSIALAGYGFIALASAMSLLRWRSKRRSLEKVDKPNETDGHRRAAEREEAWYGEALASFAHRK